MLRFVGAFFYYKGSKFVKTLISLKNRQYITKKITIP